MGETMKKFSPLLGLIGALVIAAALDLEFLPLRKIAGQSFKVGPMLWAAALFPLLWGLMIGLLAWWVLFRAERNRIVLALFIVIGLLADLLPLFSLLAISYLFPAGAVLLINLGSSVIALTTHTGVLFILIGVAGLIWRKEPT
jgi:hypothetical protein